MEQLTSNPYKVSFFTFGSWDESLSITLSGSRDIWEFSKPESKYFRVDILLMLNFPIIFV